MKARPFVKWAGGKGQLLSALREVYPDDLGLRYTRYAEPFVGGGAVLFDILNHYTLEAVYISDINRALMNCYSALRDDAERLIARLEALQEAFSPLAAPARKAYYYAQRTRFNQLKRAPENAEHTECAALFIFLNKTCFNGLYRVNRDGAFNVPIGAYENPTLCDAENLLAVSRALQNVQIVCGDYRQSADFIDERCFAYFDPPYRPLTATARFTAYNEHPFDDRAQAELAQYVNLLSEKGAKIVLSNADPKNAAPEDDFFERLYAGHRIRRVSASRSINCNSAARGRIKELLISNHEMSKP